MPSFSRGWRLTAKRGIDVVVSAVGLAVLSPLMAGIALAIRISSPGPIFYRGVRTGRDYRPFRIYKFRTMVVDGELIGGSTTALADPRITPIGRILRPRKLDELPQLFNVLKGDMSIVGPRPEVEEYTRLYTDAERVILSVRPGITDLASLQFIDLASIVGVESADEMYQTHVFHKKNAMRLRYVETWSLAGDLRILWATALALLRRPNHLDRSVE